LRFEHQILDWAAVQKLLGTDPPRTRAGRRQIRWPRSPNIVVENRQYVLVDAVLPPGVSALLALCDPAGATLVAAWLADNLASLRGLYRQRILYLPYGGGDIGEVTVGRPASWAVALGSEAWVLARDGSGPLAPASVLVQPDDARPEAPVASLDANVLAVLQAAGVRFGEDVPRAASARVLRARGGTASPADLEAMLRASIEEAHGDPECHRQLQQLLLTFPLLPVPPATRLVDGARRVTAIRCVRVAGAGRRSGLDWVVALADFAEGSPESRVFDAASLVVVFPEQTGAAHCMDYLEWVWRTQPEADTVRQQLPRAYDYLSQDLPSQPEMTARWEAIRSHACVYTLGRRWAPVAGGTAVYFDDFGGCTGTLVPKGQIATPGHLGEKQQGVSLLGVPRLSSVYRSCVDEGEGLPCPDEWLRRFAALEQTLLDLLHLGDRGVAAGEEIGHLRLRRVQSMVRRIVAIASGEVRHTQGIGALDAEDRTVVVAGDPEDFVEDLCPMLLGRYAGSDATVANIESRVTRLLMFLDTDRFDAALRKLREAGGLPCDTEATAGGEHRPEGTTASVSGEDIDDSGGEPAGERDQGEESQAAGEKGHDEKAEDDTVPESVRRAGGARGQGTGRAGRPTGGGRREGYAVGSGAKGSHTADDRERMLTYYQHQVDMLKAGTLVPAATDDGDTGERVPTALDEMYRQAVVKYERRQGRFATAKPPTQEGHDIDSFSAPDGTPNRLLVRRIEVKGRTHPWTEAQTVELSRAQFDNASRRVVESDLPCDQDFDYWLYVVEDRGGGSYNVLPVRNPAANSAKLEVRGGTWCQFVEMPVEVTVGQSAGSAPPQGGPARTPGRRSILDLKAREQAETDETGDPL